MQKEKNMKKPIAIYFALVLLTSGVAVAQDSMQEDNMKGDASKNEVQVTGKIGNDGKTL
jgi:pentapeptide MXKDX repeat protein